MGVEPIGYSDADAHVDLTVARGREKQRVNLWGCDGASGGGSGGGTFHPPLFSPGQTVSFRYLLKGYRLTRGSYSLRVSGKAGFRWFFGAGRNASSVSQRKQGDPVEGATFDVTEGLIVRDGSEAELRQRYAHYVEEATGLPLTDTWRQAREAIAEIGPPFLEKTILGFADQPETASLAVDGSIQIANHSSRSHLAQLYNKTTDLTLRRRIMEGLARIAGPEDMPFFASVVPGRSTWIDDEIRVFALLAIGRLGGDAAVKVLQSLAASDVPEVRRAWVTGFGNTRSAAAVPVLIDMYADEANQNSVCGALSTLTHLSWCEGGADVSEMQAKWRRWWSAHPAGLALHGMEDCVSISSLRPLNVSSSPR